MNIIPRTLDSTKSITQEPIKLFVGSEIGNEKAEKALHWSIINTSTVPIEINWMSDMYNGSVWEGWNKGRDHRKQFSGEGWKTNFSAFRWAIPELCGFKGKAIYLDVDQILLKYIKQIWELSKESYADLAITPARTDVMLINCEKFSKDWWPSLEKMKPSGKKQQNYRKLVEDKFGIGPLDTIYNCLDGEAWNSDKTRLVHYTKMCTQPWRPFPNNMSYKSHAFPHLEILWKDHYSSALEFELNNKVGLGAPQLYQSPPIVVGQVISKVADYTIYSR